MRYLLPFFFLCFLSIGATYLVENKDGSVSIVNHVDSARDDLQEVIDDLGLSDQKIIVMPKTSDLPSAEDRKYWKFNSIPLGKKIVVDEDKKQADLIAKTEKKAKKDTVLSKLKITEEELKDLIS